MQAMKTPEARTAATHDVVGHFPFGTPRVCATALDAKASASAASEDANNAQRSTPLAFARRRGNAANGVAPSIRLLHRPSCPKTAIRLA
jgi:hypothetical protein